MSYAKVHAAQVDGLDGHIVDIEVDILRGLHSFSIVGLPDKAVEEARDRVSAAIKNTGKESPKKKNRKVVISLAPASLKKEGANFDLGIALAYLLAVKDIKFNPKEKLFLGELSLDGRLRPIRGTLRLVQAALEHGFKEVFVPKENGREAALIDNIHVYPAETLGEILQHLDEKNEFTLEPRATTSLKTSSAQHSVDMKDVRGQPTAKRALEIAAAGAHNIALYGPPGTGKTMLASAFCSILPSLSRDEALEVTAIHSIAGTLHDEIIIDPPLRNPHHTASHVALIGGGSIVRPGEITLAHGGVLFLDEFPEFDRRVLETLRQPLEDGVVSVSRARGSYRFPAQFILVAALNPCPCGYWGTHKECTCSASNLERYRRKLSGPIIDRIDLWVTVDNFDPTENMESLEGEGSHTIRSRVWKARRIQKTRNSNKLNRDISSKDIEKRIKLEKEAKEVIKTANTKLELSPRSYFRILKVARTIADLETSDTVASPHILEALQYRPKLDL